MRLWKLAALFWCGWAVLQARAEDGVSAHALKIGMSNALSGPAAGLGLQLRAGAMAYFDKVNKSGGVYGRSIELVSVDDAYDPKKAAETTDSLIKGDKVFALFGYVGTPTSAVAVPLAVKAGVPYLFPFTGAEFLRNPVNPIVFNLRASYYDETEALVARLVKEQGAKRIALFIQDDEFGEAGKAGVLRALQKRGMSPVLEARYRRNTVAVDAGFAQLAKLNPDAVVFIGTYRPFAALVKLARGAAMTTQFATVSFVGSSEFVKHAGPAGDGTIISQVMPSPDDASDAFVKQYQADVAQGARNYGSLEGYANAAILVEALRRAGREPSRTALLRGLETLRTELGTIPVAFDAKRHQGMDRVYLSHVKDGKVIPLN